MLHIIAITVPLLLEGILTTIEVSVLAIVLSLALGLGMAALGLWKRHILRRAVKLYVKVFRCIPFMVQIYIIYYGLPTLGIRLPAFWTGALVLGLYTAAYVEVIVESGVRALPKGQNEAAVAMGMPYLMRLRRILFPQTIGIILPPLTGQLMQTVKDSSVLSVKMCIRDRCIESPAYAGHCRNRGSLRRHYSSGAPDCSFRDDPAADGSGSFSPSGRTAGVRGHFRRNFHPHDRRKSVPHSGIPPNQRGFSSKALHRINVHQRCIRDRRKSGGDFLGR